MSWVEDVLSKKRKKRKYGSVISMTDMNKVSEKIRNIAAEAGLGVAILMAWQHGLKIRHIPLKRDDDENEEEIQVEVIAANDDCPYVFAHVPIRMIRGDKSKLIELGIMNQDADPALFIYHEDGLIGTFSFQNPKSVGLDEEDIQEILDTLAQQGVLMRANIDNRQIQFKDLAAKKSIAESGEKVYVRVENQPLEGKAWLPIEVNWEEAWDYIVKTLRKKSACNYCSVQALTPREVTIHSAHVFSHTGQRKDGLATARNYQLGFTFAPFGDPREVCHFLAWDFPHVNDLVMNMEPQAYSFSDLIRLVRVINRDISEFCGYKLDPPVTGICNHWAGNSIYHQHYQFVRIADLPLLDALNTADPIASYKDIEVRKFANWPSPAFLITSLKRGRDQDVMRVADRVAKEWRLLSDKEDRTYGNGIAIRNHTQNIFVTILDDGIIAIFVPRDRHKLDTSESGNLIQKKNAGVLEMMGYFLIDDPDDFDKLGKASPGKRKELADSWLKELAPRKQAIADFETSIRICLNDLVTWHEERIDKIIGDTPGDLRQEAWTLASTIQHDQRLGDEQRGHLYRELLSAVLESRIGDLPQQPTE